MRNIYKAFFIISFSGITALSSCETEEVSPLTANDNTAVTTLKVGPGDAPYWTQLSSMGTDIGAGADGSIFALSNIEVSATGGFGIMKWNGNSWNTISSSAAVKIAVDGKGNPWVVNKSNLIFRYNGSINWEQLPGTATDIAIGADGSVFAIGTTLVNDECGFNIMKWNEAKYSWSKITGGAVRIAVDPNGNPWIVTKSHLIYKYNGKLFVQVPGNATDIAIGANGAIFIISNEWVSQTGGNSILKWDGSAFVTVSGAAINIAVDNLGKPWVTNYSNSIYKNNDL